MSNPTDLARRVQDRSPEMPKSLLEGQKPSTFGRISTADFQGWADRDADVSALLAYIQQLETSSEDWQRRALVAEDNQRSISSHRDALREIVENPQKWMKWCDEKIMDENLSLHAQVGSAEAQVQQFREEHRQELERMGRAWQGTIDAHARELAAVRASHAAAVHKAFMEGYADAEAMEHRAVKSDVILAWAESASRAMLEDR